MVLTNRKRYLPINDRNRLTLKQIQTEDYDLSKTQKNVADVILSISEALNFSLVSIAQQPTSLAYDFSGALTPQNLLFPDIISNTVQSYSEILADNNQVLNAFTAPADGNYLCVLHANFLGIAVANRITVFLNSNTNGLLSQVTGTKNADNTLSLNISYPIKLDADEYVYYTLAPDVLDTFSVVAHSRVSFSRLV